MPSIFGLTRQPKHRHTLLPLHHLSFLSPIAVGCFGFPSLCKLQGDKQNSVKTRTPKIESYLHFISQIVYACASTLLAYNVIRYTRCQRDQMNVHTCCMK